MSKYTAEQVESAAEIMEQDQNAPSWKRLSAMLRDYAALLRELESASARVPDGWQLVPREPTSEMVKAGDDCGFRSYTGTWSITPDACWQAMLAAAPKPEKEE